MMYLPDHAYEAASYITTSTGNIVARSAVLQKAEAIEIPGGKCIIEKGCILHGDLAPVKLNRYVIIDENSILRPPLVACEKYAPLTIGKYVYIGKNCLIESAVIGQGVSIGNECKLSPRCILKDYVLVEDGSIVPPDMVVPPFAIVSGNPAQIIGELPASISTTAPTDAVGRYKAYQPIS
jgi:dynactin-5